VLDFRLESFLAVYEEGGYTKAAERLHLTQPAVSQHIRYLEERYKARLFSFQGRSLSLTEAGLILYRYASAARAEGLRVGDLIAKGKDRLVLKIGATRTLGEYLLPEALISYLRLRPEAEPSLVVDNTKALLARLREGRIDCAFIEGIFEGGDFETSVFLRDSFIPVCAPQDDLARGSHRLRDLFSRRLILREAGSGSRAVLENALAARNSSVADFRALMEIGNIEAMKTLAAESLGLAFLYERSVLRELDSGRLARVALRDFSVSHDYSFACRSGSLLRERCLEFLGFVKDSLRA
jgi:LysR family transcriptional regulator, transcriptional activator of the cysJI operon